MLAHITKNGDDEFINQSLKEHCINTANYAKKSMERTGFQNCAYVAGLLHDMGKAKKEFQEYLYNGSRGEKVIRGSVNHTYAGVIYLLEKYHDIKLNTQFEVLTCEIIAFAIGAHHGLFDCCDLDGINGFEKRIKKDREQIHFNESYEEFFNNVINEDKLESLFENAVKEVEVFINNLSHIYKNKEDGDRQQFFQISLLCRALLSAVIYGDRKDTAQFMNQIEIGYDIDWKKELEYFEKKICKFDSESDINKIRKIISDKCYNFSNEPKGIYKLNIPTGAGKTLCSLRYSLAHANKYEKKRIIFVIPLLSILDQNAKIIKEYVHDEKIVLEHHSNVINDDSSNAELDYYELLSTTYEKPIIITTMVQFLNVLFSHKTTAIERMQAFNNSVIVIDEVQTIPKKTLLMFNMALNFLSDYCSSTIILSSATQPCFDEIKWKLHYANNSEMVTLTEEEENVFNRSNVINKLTKYGLNIEEYIELCGKIIEEYSSVLIICNTKNEALEIYKSLSEKDNLLVYHLSTSMCKAHREVILKDLTHRLKELQNDIKNINENNTMKIVCVSTQLVEAGVDFSFEAVIRVLAGIDNLAQSAGRCNRSGEYGSGTVYLTNLKAEKLNNLSDIEEAQNATISVLYGIEDSQILEKNTVNNFFKKLYGNIGDLIEYPFEINDKNGVEYKMTELWANKNYQSTDHGYILKEPFLTMGKKFTVFEDSTIDVIVSYGESEKKVHELEFFIEKNPYDLQTIHDLIEQLKDYTIGIFHYQKEILEENGFLSQVNDKEIYILNKKAYSDEYGLDIPKEDSIENFIL